ncbi:MAG: ABC transporter permease [Acidimicrobiaceae bacterium]|nr:ABC transporter permease [Acidimicrobiaceae bacterium]MBO0747561.1 ABC transporter permease [Acidimicrobiaceae bacterium]
MTAVTGRQDPASPSPDREPPDPRRGGIPSASGAWNELRNSRELFANLTLRELRSKYKRSWLGWGWSMINPLAYTAIYTIVFHFVLRAAPLPGVNGLSVFALWLLCALLPWNFFQMAVNTAISSLPANANLIQKSYFPRQLLPVSSVAAALVSHFIEMALLVLALVAFGDYEAFFYLPMTFLLILILTVFATGLGLLLGVANVYFRDVSYFMTILFLAWMYLTPIVYPPQILHGNALFLSKVNPMTDATIAFRDGLYYGRLPSPIELGAIITAAAITFAIGWTVFAKYEGRLVEEL